MKKPCQLSFDFIADREHSYAEVTGTVKHVHYDNPYTGWKVIDVSADNTGELVKLTGYLPNIGAGDRINARCTGSDHPVFGRCLQIDEFYKILPFQKEGAMKYMAAMIEGIGEHLAEQIIDRFGDKTLEILEDEPERLSEIEGISTKSIEKIRKSTEKINTVVKELILLGFSPIWAGRIYLKYGRDAARIVKSSPYKLIRDFKGIGFKKAEIIARQIGIDELDEERIHAAIHFSLRSSLKRTGHNFLYMQDLQMTVSRLLKLPLVYTEAEILSDPELIIDDNRVYLTPYYNAENNIASLISDKITLPGRSIDDFAGKISSIEQKIGIKFSEEQQEAIRVAAENAVTIISGAAGTGKTTLCKGLLELLDILGLTYNLCAPTGKAANKLNAVTGRSAHTIHRLLRYAPSVGYRINEKEPLDADYLIIDEASMVDLLLLEAVFRGAGHSTRMVFIGDPHQIPPVEVGNSLQALIGSYAVSQVVLPDIFRQKKESRILMNASLVNLEKEFPMENTHDFKFINVSAPIEMIKALHDSIDELKKEGFHPTRDINILTPLNKGGGDISVSNLNVRLRNHLNPATAENSFYIYEREWRINDKIMQRKNDYDLDIYNGDIGFIISNNNENKTITVDFFGKLTEIPYKKTENLVHNYAMTVHKAQGSEARAVIFLSTRAGCYFLLNKNLFYTAITRAKEKLIMIMPYEVVQMAIRFNIRRQSHLSSRIQKIVMAKDAGKEKD
ncbi:MAG: AAA family ATPase [Elusimicrobiota bacterium]